MSKEGFIYIIEDEPNICKIGKTTKPVAKRCAQLSTCFHREFKILGFFKSEDINADESVIHVLLRDYKIRGEWFKISYDQIIAKTTHRYTFKKYEYPYRPEGKLNIKMSFSVSKDVLLAFNEIYNKRINEGRKSNKDWLICEAIELLIEKEKSDK